MTRFLAFLVLSLWCQPALAQEVTCNPEGNQQEMNACARDDFRSADAELNGVWKEVMPIAKSYDMDLRKMGDDGRPGYEATLRKAQRSWIDYRDASCEFDGFQARGGSLEALLYQSCRARVTKARTQELRQILQDLGNQ